MSKSPISAFKTEPEIWGMSIRSVGVLGLTKINPFGLAILVTKPTLATS